MFEPTAAYKQVGPTREVTYLPLGLCLIKQISQLTDYCSFSGTGRKNVGLVQTIHKQLIITSMDRSNEKSMFNCGHDART